MSDRIERASAVPESERVRRLEVELKARDEFFSAVAHELRNPLNALHLTLAGITRAQSGNTPLDPQQLGTRVKRASAQVSRLAKLVDDMLDVGRISAGRLVIQIETFDAAGVLSEAVARVKETSNFFAISCSIPASVPLTSDRARFEQIASNLLSNAVLYGNQKPIEIRLACDDSTVRLEVSDHGIGIAEGDQALIFERFQKVPGPSPSVGFGLGLWIAREVVGALHGQISVSSKLHEGSTFIVELPTLHSVGTAGPVG